MKNRLKIWGYVLRMFLYLFIPYVAGFVALMLHREYWFPFYPYMIILFMVLSAPYFFVLKKWGDSHPRKFVNSCIIASFFRMLLSVLVIIIYVWIKPDTAIPFVIAYFVFYMVLTISEIVMFKPKNAPQKGH
jgi:hypothetical protein